MLRCLKNTGKKYCSAQITPSMPFFLGVPWGEIRILGAPWLKKLKKPWLADVKTSLQVSAAVLQHRNVKYWCWSEAKASNLTKSSNRSWFSEISSPEPERGQWTWPVLQDDRASCRWRKRHSMWWKTSSNCALFGHKRSVFETKWTVGCVSWLRVLLGYE